MKKLAEMQRILAPLGINVVTAKMLGITLPDVVEDGDTFEANAKIKADSACKITGMPAIADDSGICVSYIDDAPGIYSARYLGEDTSYRVKNKNLIDIILGCLNYNAMNNILINEEILKQNNYDIKNKDFSILLIMDQMLME